MISNQDTASGRRIVLGSLGEVEHPVIAFDLAQPDRVDRGISNQLERACLASQSLPAIRNHLCDSTRICAANSRTE